MPAVLMNTPSPLPRSTTFVSPVTIRTPTSSAARRIEATIRSQRLQRQALFENEARAQGQRPRPGHGQVVDRAVDGQLADVAAGKEQRADDERVGRHGEPLRRARRAPRRRAAGCSAGSEPNAGRKNPSISRRITRPPPPWAICTVA